MPYLITVLRKKTKKFEVIGVCKEDDIFDLMTGMQTALSDIHSGNVALTVDFDDNYTIKLDDVTTVKATFVSADDKDLYLFRYGYGDVQ